MTSFSVIVPNYNHGRFLKQRLDSILQQTWNNFEIIILDDCSTDESWEIIESYRQESKVSHIIFNEENSGSPFHQWKKGLTLARFDWIWIAESDDYADRSFLAEAARAIALYPSIGIFYSDSYIIDEVNHSSTTKFSERKNKHFNNNKWNEAYYRNGIDEINESLKFDCTVNNVSSMVFNKNKAIDMLDELRAFQYYGDWYFIVSMCMQAGIYYCDKPLNCYRRHHNSLLHGDTSFMVSKLEYFKILKLLYEHPDVTAKEKLLEHFAFHYLNFGWMSDGMKKGISMFRAFLETDKSLGQKLIPKIITSRFRKAPGLAFNAFQ